jgi:hypothetical protein
MDRIYRKPEQALVARVAPNPAQEVIRSLSLDQKLELLSRLREGDEVDVTRSLPLLDVAAPTR